MRIVIYLFVFCFVSGHVTGQNPSRGFISMEQDDLGLVIKVSDGTYLIRAYSEQILETTFLPENEKFEFTSHAVESDNLSQPFKFGETSSGVISIWMGDFSIVMHKSPFQIFYHHKDEYLISEGMGYHKKSSHQCIGFNLDSSEVLFGGGSRALGMNRRGNRLELYNKAHYGYEERSELMNYTMPVVLSSKKYALHFDNSAIGYLDLDSESNNTLTYETIGGRMTYQLVVGENWKDLLREYTFLTGRQPMPPRWAFGNFASRFGYHSEREARAVVQKFKEDSIPLDAIIFDLYWFGDTITGTMGNLEFHTDSFPEPQKMISDFKQENIKTILITEPFILSSSKKWKEANTKQLLALDESGHPYRYDFYFGNTGLLDIYKPHVRKWFWGVYRDLRNMGVEGIWGDLGEPEVHPSDLFHNGIPADFVHNTYGHNWARLIHSGYKEDFPNERPFILMRSGYSGSQRFGMIPWSGDVNRSWGGLRSQMEISLQMGLQGMGYMHSDLGGFAGANDDPELYVRWLQYGVFQPIFRPHAQEEVASEPIFKDDKTKDLARKAIELRYKLLPYNYSLAHENHVSGTPLMRPLFMEFEDEDYLRARTYMWGDAFIVQAITDPLDSNLDSNAMSLITLPVSEDWCDMTSGVLVGSNEPQMDGSIMKVAAAEAGIDHIPVYVRAGSFIPTIKRIMSTEEYDPKDVVIQCYYTNNLRESNGFWYEDDGETPQAYEKGLYFKKHYKFQKRGRKKRITVSLDQGINYTQEVPSNTLKILNSDVNPRKLRINGRKVKHEYDKTNRCIFLSHQVMDQFTYPKEVTWK